MSIAFFRMAPDEALEELGELFQMMDALCLPPEQILCTIIALIPKPDNGERPIGILSFIYRIHARLHRIDIKDWELETRTDWDTAIAGNSALQAALKQMLLDEVAYQNGRSAAEIYVDIKKFYDHISWFRLI